MKIEKISDSTISVDGVYYSTRPFITCVNCALHNYCANGPTMCSIIFAQTGIITRNKSFEKVDMETKETKEIKINIPEGYEIDEENSTFDCIKFKKTLRWRDNRSAKISGYYINELNSEIYPLNSVIHLLKSATNTKSNYCVFATEKQAKSALAMARISQIMANDKRFGGIITDEEWKECTIKYTIIRSGSDITSNNVTGCVNIYIYDFLAFHTSEQRDLFLEENEDLVKDYLMID